jgi:hypothetical protein
MFLYLFFVDGSPYIVFFCEHKRRIVIPIIMKKGLVESQMTAVFEIEGNFILLHKKSQERRNEEK